jgi:hypothetical protein
VGPNHLLWVVDLVHDQTHQQVDNTVAHYVYLSGKQRVIRKNRIINEGSKGNDEQDGMQAHPFFIAHDLRVMLETMTNPH